MYICVKWTIQHFGRHADAILYTFVCFSVFFFLFKH